MRPPRRRTSSARASHPGGVCLAQASVRAVLCWPRLISSTSDCLDARTRDGMSLREGARPSFGLRAIGGECPASLAARARPTEQLVGRSPPPRGVRSLAGHSAQRRAWAAARRRLRASRQLRPFRASRRLRGGLSARRAHTRGASAPRAHAPRRLREAGTPPGRAIALALSGRIVLHIGATRRAQHSVRASRGVGKASQTVAIGPLCIDSVDVVSGCLLHIHGSARDPGLDGWFAFLSAPGTLKRLLDTPKPSLSPIASCEGRWGCLTLDELALHVTTALFCSALC